MSLQELVRIHTAYGSMFQPLPFSFIRDDEGQVRAVTTLQTYHGTPLFRDYTGASQRQLVMPAGLDAPPAEFHTPARRKQILAKRGFLSGQSWDNLKEERSERNYLRRRDDQSWPRTYSVDEREEDKARSFIKYHQKINKNKS